MARVIVILAVILAGAALVGCGSDTEATAPLTLEQRAPSEVEAPGSEPDPVETPRTVSGYEQFESTFGDAFIEPTPEEIAEFEASDFLAAIGVTRFFPSEPGGAHSRDAAHVNALVLQFESEEGAQTAATWMHENGLKPCPEQCAAKITEIDVDSPEGATGVRRTASAEDLEVTGAEGPPFDEYAIQFTDGPFAYEIRLHGPPGAVSEEQAEEIVSKLYDRVQGAPASTGDGSGGETGSSS